METRRLRFLVELSRLGSMRAVADESHITTHRQVAGACPGRPLTA